MSKRYTKKYKQGTYRVRNASKYKGSNPIVYRSGLELTLMKWLDCNESVISWGSETVILPYISPADQRVHRYFVDFNFTMKRGNEIKKYLVEVKPHSQTSPPKKGKNMKSYLYAQKAYIINEAKWKCATDWCDSHGYKFLIFTEKHLKR